MIDQDTRALLDRFGFDEKTFETLRARLRAGELGDATNRIRGRVEPPAPEDVTPLPPRGSAAREELAAAGRAAIAAGKVGAIVLAGGMATRFGGVVKAAVEALDGLTFLELKLKDLQAAARDAGGKVPAFLMTSFATHDDVTRLAAKGSTDSVPVETFPQLISLRLQPDAELFRDRAGNLSPYAPGHGDLPEAIRRSGLLERFMAGGGELLFMSNVDNLTATLDPAVVGAHLAGKKPVTAEMAPNSPGDKGGAPARVDGVPQIVEGFRFPSDFDQDSIPVFNTNTLVFDAKALADDFRLTWFAVTKKVDELPAIQLERLVGELTAFLPATFLRVEREGEDARFQPAKDPEELVRRQDEIRTALRARGVI
ncbi:MAG: UTP--glucose-1-phosphate uridylyltransferase [Myxococcales bacterium]|nr:UTP--glucose-1-phosphate uridylyltransferase [Myxococcales bacterium]